jgi:hypothetical protein
MTPESAALRESIRQGLIGAHIDRPEFDWAVARVYELERQSGVSASCDSYSPSGTCIRAGMRCQRLRHMDGHHWSGPESDRGHWYDDGMAQP